MVAFGRFGTTVSKYTELADAIQENTTTTATTFAESLGRMFSVSLPEGIDPQLLSETMAQWKELWLVPAVMAGAILVAFVFLFHDKQDLTDFDNAPGEETP